MILVNCFAKPLTIQRKIFLRFVFEVLIDEESLKNYFDKIPKESKNSYVGKGHVGIKQILLQVQQIWTAYLVT